MSNDEKQCPFCGETIKLVAIKCKHCLSDLSEFEIIKDKTKPTEIPCSYCGELIDSESSECAHCSSDLTKKISEITPKPISKQIKNTTRTKITSEVNEKSIENPFSARSLVVLTLFVIGILWYALGNSDLNSSSEKIKYLEQSTLQDIVSRYSKDYWQAYQFHNEISATQIRLDRKKQLEKLPENFRDWEVALLSTSTTGNGDATVSFKDPTGNILLTAYLSPSDKIYAQLAGTKFNTKNFISGKVQVNSSSNDYFKENSFTEKGAMTLPDFVITLKSLSNAPINQSTNAKAKVGETCVDCISDWELLGNSKSTSEWIGPISRNQNENNPKAWILHDYNQPYQDGFPIASTADYVEINCSSKDMLVLRIINYSEHMGLGATRENTIQDSWKKYNENTVYGLLLNKVCELPTQNKKASQNKLPKINGAKITQKEVYDDALMQELLRKRDPNYE
jgi:hypothetical protein